MPDAATEQRQRELEKRHRDLSKPVDPIGSTADSLRSVRGFENITDADLENRATFNLRDHMMRTKDKQQALSEGLNNAAGPATIDLTAMSPEELAGLEKAARQQRKSKEKP